QQADHQLQSAKEELQRDVDAAKQKLRSEVADLAVNAAGKILDETLDEARHKKLVDKVLSQLPKN
ncbi:MAG TPA: F0F1 ATP synthase subunit B, partial [Bacteroidota bacterium]|nr:F0F1 ATP synthase subunit B [Bacteroidota bacterium]